MQHDGMTMPRFLFFLSFVAGFALPECVEQPRMAGSNQDVCTNCLEAIMNRNPRNADLACNACVTDHGFNCSCKCEAVGGKWRKRHFASISNDGDAALEPTRPNPEHGKSTGRARECVERPIVGTDTVCTQCFAAISNHNPEHHDLACRECITVHGFDCSCHCILDENGRWEWWRHAKFTKPSIPQVPSTPQFTDLVAGEKPMIQTQGKPATMPVEFSAHTACEELSQPISHSSSVWEGKPAKCSECLVSVMDRDPKKADSACQACTEKYGLDCSCYCRTSASGERRGSIDRDTTERSDKALKSLLHANREGSEHRRSILDSFVGLDNSTAGHRAPFKVDVLSAEHPRMWRVASFLSRNEAQYITRAYEDSLNPCYSVGEADSVISEFLKRSCQELQVLMLDRHHVVMAQIERRLAGLLGPHCILPSCRDPANVGYFRMQLVRYLQGDGFGTHLDESSDGPMPFTGMIYLTDGGVDAGGETQFRQASGGTIISTPRQGDLLLWSSCDSEGNPDTSAMHQGMPIRAGAKWILNNFFDSAKISPDRCEDPGFIPDFSGGVEYVL